MTLSDDTPDRKRLVSNRSEHLVGPRYLVALLIGGIATLAAFVGLLLILDRMGHLPPPPIANNICIDEKLSFLRRHPPTTPNLLVIGSSIAWRHFDGASVVAVAPGTRPLNGGFCGLRANQTVYVANWLLDRLPSVRQVVMIASPQDFETCRMHPDALFDRDAANGFIFEQAWLWGFYFRFFDPASLVRNVSRVRAMRSNIDPISSIVFTPFGDGPIDTTASRRTLEYGGLPGYDPSCFAALRSLAQRLASEDRRFVVVNTPLHPEWKRRHDPDARLLQSLEKNIWAAMAGTSGEYWDGDSAMRMEPDAFIDGIHLRWSAARPFSENLARVLRLSSGTLAADKVEPVRPAAHSPDIEDAERQDHR
jgi:hypothetical protein